jgi:hypothetical protein
VADAEKRMTRVEQIKAEKTEIQIAARLAALRCLGEDTARAYDEAVAADMLPVEHARLRRMLLALLSPPRTLR